MVPFLIEMSVSLSILFFLFPVVCTSRVFADSSYPVIDEIMYNPPESDTDKEWIRL